MEVRTRWFLAKLGVAALLVAACGGDGSSAPQDSSTTTPTSVATTSSPGQGSGAFDELPDPCSAWSQEELLEVTGLEFPPGELNTQFSVGGQMICDWITEGLDFASTQTLVKLDEGTYDASLAAFPEAIVLDIPGADAAYSIDDGKIIAMRVGDWFVQVAFLPATGQTVDPAQLIELAEIALANL